MRKIVLQELWCLAILMGIGVVVFGGLLTAVVVSPTACSVMMQETSKVDLVAFENAVRVCTKFHGRQNPCDFVKCESL